MRNILSISPRKSTQDVLSVSTTTTPKQRRNTIDIPLPTEEVEINGFPPSNKTEKLKRSSSIKFKPRDRVKILFPTQYKNRTGYVVEDEFVENSRGLLEIELDYELNDGDGYQQLIDLTKKRQRITIKHPSKQLIPYKYMKCQRQHFVTDITAETLLKINHIITFILCSAIISFILAIDSSNWNNNALFYLFSVSQSFCIGLGFYNIMILSFIGITIKKMSGKNNLIQLGAVHDECHSYHWLKSTQYKPWWMCGKHESVMEYTLQKTAKIIFLFGAMFLFSIILYISDQIEWYLVLICVITIFVPTIFALDIIRNTIPSKQQHQQSNNTNISNPNANTSLSRLSEAYRNNDNNNNDINNINQQQSTSNITGNISPNGTKKGRNPFDD